MKGISMAGLVRHPLRVATALGIAALATACGTSDPPAAPARAIPVTTVAPVPTAAPTTAVPTGPTVDEIADALGDIEPLRHPRDNTGSCAVTRGCLGLITAGTVSIYQWPDASSAGRYIGGNGNADRVGPYVLSYRTNEQHSTPPDVRQAYAEKVRELVGPVA
jgi:hypothetical protein